MFINLPETSGKRVVIVGGGFAGLTLARKLNRKYFDVVLLDKNNYHQFQPLLYQVATAGLEPSAISFPFRKVFQKRTNTHFRLCKVLYVDPDQRQIETSAGTVAYDYLVIAAGCTNNFFGMEHVQIASMPMKSLSEALGLRNNLLCMFERAICNGKSEALNIVVVGGGPTGVEISGALAEMRDYVLPKDYPDINFSDTQIILVEALPRLLSAMSDHASVKARAFLEKMGVKVMLDVAVKDYADGRILLSNGHTIATQSVIWASGVTANYIDGLNRPENTGRGGRLKADAYHRVEGFDRIFAIGDVCLQTETKYPNGHPQMAQAAMQQARNLAENLLSAEKGKPMNEFRYNNKGSMATVGRNKAVVDLPHLRLAGFFAWVIWMFVHLMAILGVKNKVLTLIDWTWSYLTYNPSLRLIISPKGKKCNTDVSG